MEKVGIYKLSLKRVFFVIAVLSSVLCLMITFTGCSRVSTTENIPKGEMTKILFLGDTSFGENYKGSPEILEQKGYDYTLAKVSPLLKSSDFVIANLETPITDMEESPYKDSKTWLHWTSVEHAPATLKKHNIHTVSLANNHTLDFGLPGLEQTFDVMKKNDMQWFGAGLNEKEAARPIIKTFTRGDKKLKIAVIGAFEYSKSYDNKYNFYAKGEKGGAYRLSGKKIAEQIKQLKEADPETYVIVFPHWGKNYAWKNNRQTKAGHKFIKNGADIVIGHGGHSMQEIELFENKWIIYGIGNFAFLSPGRYKKKKAPPFSYGAQLILAVKNGKLQKWMRIYPIHTDNRVNKYQPRPVTEDEFNKFTELIFDKSPITQQTEKMIRKSKDDAGYFLEFPLGT